MARPRVLLWSVTAAVAVTAWVVYRRWTKEDEDVVPLQPKRSAAEECAFTISDDLIETRPSNGWREARSSVDCGGCDEVENAGSGCVPNGVKMSLVHRLAPILCDETINFIVPEETRVHVKTFGCSHNISDSEFMAGLLKQAGFQLVDRIEDCDVAVLNSCTVKNPSQDGAVNLAVKCQTMGKKVVMGGCVSQADTSIPQLETVSSIGVKNIDRVVEAVIETLKGNVYRSMNTRRSLPELDLPKVRKNPLVEIVPLSTGCLGACTYCKTKHARGVLGSYKPEAILKRISTAIDDKVQQIWLTSEDTGAYGIDLGTNIADLLEQIQTLVEEKSSPENHVMVRLGMTNPPYMLAHLDRLAKVLKSPHFFEFLHVPVQSGSDEVLLGMNREYTVEDFNKCAEGLLSNVPQLTLATDFICGFPGETEAAHHDSLKMIEHYKFPVLNISQFYPRPGTPAAAMKRVPTQVVKQRSQEMTKVFMSYSTWDRFVGTVDKVWFSGVSDRNKDQIVGHTKQYIKVVVPRDDEVIGKCVSVKFVESSKWHLLGEIQKNN